MKIWKFEFKRRENTKWDYILPIGFSLLVYPLFRGFHREIIKIFGFPLSETLSLLLLAGIIIIMYIISLFLSRFQRTFVFPLLYLFSLLFMWVDTNLYLVFLTFAINGLGFTAGNITLTMLFGESQNIAKGKLLAPIIVGIVFGITGAVVSFILVLIPPLAIYIILFLPILWISMLIGEVYNYEPLYESMLEIDVILWFFIFFVLGVAAVRIWRKLKEPSNKEPIIGGGER